jgi:hypothetical protein
MTSNVTSIKTPSTRAKRQALIDEFGRLQQKVDAFKETKDRHALIREQIAAWYDNEDAHRPFLEEGQYFTLQVSERTHTRVINNMGKLFKLLGMDTFLKLCKFPLAAVDTNIPGPQHKGFIDEAQDGPRKLKVIAKQPLREAA